MTARFKGLTWDHPRGFNALNAAAPDGLIQWDKQPLEGFESAPIEELCSRYDLVVLDHPHLGEALAANCLRPLEDAFSPGDLARIKSASIGPSYDSYTMAQKQWALPLDAATQVIAMRSDLVDTVPQTWSDVCALSEQTGKVALCLAGPHAYLSWLSIATALEPACDLRNADHWFSDATGQQAYEIMQALYAHTPKQTHGLNPIGLLEHMSTQRDVAVCPLIYGYVNYSGARRQHPIAFFEAPVAQSGGRHGTILGGTGIAISHRCTPDVELKNHLLWLMTETAQGGFIPENDGQPSARISWLDKSVNAPVGNFYLNTHRSLENAAIRPRHDGYIALQSAGSNFLRDALRAKMSAANAAEKLRQMFYNSTTRKDVA